MVAAARYLKAKNPTRSLERSLRESGVERIAGVDEVGRGAWAGPMLACAAIIDLTKRYPFIRDSKSLSADQRVRGEALLQRHNAIYACGSVSPQEIDDLGMTMATALCMRRAVDALCLIEIPEHILVDAFPFDAPHGIPVEPILHGDRECLSIAAASVLAKVTRDRLMVALHQEDDRFAHDQHKGYGTALHQERLRLHGLSPMHRRRFVPEELFLPVVY